MKKLFTLIAALFMLGTTAAQAQSMKVYSKTDNVVVAFPLSESGNMVFGYDPELGGRVFNIGQYSLEVSEIDSIVVDKQLSVPANTLMIHFDDKQGASLLASPEMLAYIDNYEIKGNHVSVVADPNVDQEINYVLSGSATNGSFYMDGHFKSTITLDGVSLTNPDSAAICIDNGKRINIILTDGTVNSFVDGTANTKKACFFVNGHAEFKGAGTLNITGLSRHAYASDEYTLLKPSTGTINILASANDGMHIEQYFQMDGGTLTINNVKGDCIDVSKTKDVTDENNGWVFVNDGKLTMTVSADDTKGLKSDSCMTINGGTITATVSANGGKGFSVGSDLVIDQAEGKTTQIQMDVAGTTYTDPADATNTSKCRGIKVKGNYTFKGGNISMNVTGKKAKGISVDGTYTYVGGTSNVVPE